MSENNPLEIDEFNLEKEWKDQPTLMGKWVKDAADAQYAYDSAKSSLTLVEADLGHEVRLSPGNYGVTKISNDAVDIAVKGQSAYRVAIRDVDKARHTLALVNGMVTALDHRKRALGMLVELWTKDYYANPKVSQMDDETKAAVRSRGRQRRDQRKEDGDG